MKKHFLPQVAQIRHAARTIVRELGMLGDAHASLGITNSQVHALIELERDNKLSVIELANRLRLEKSSVSRLIDAMEKQKWVLTIADCNDRRRRLINITSDGQKKLSQVHRQADERVSGALRRLDVEEQKKVCEGLELYARALSNSKD